MTVLPGSAADMMVVRAAMGLVVKLWLSSMEAPNDEWGKNIDLNARCKAEQTNRMLSNESMRVGLVVCLEMQSS
jgi:hypothetical protein